MAKGRNFALPLRVAKVLPEQVACPRTRPFPPPGKRDWPGRSRRKSLSVGGIQVHAQFCRQQANDLQVGLSRPPAARWRAALHAAVAGGVGAAAFQRRRHGQDHVGLGGGGGREKIDHQLEFHLGQQAGPPRRRPAGLRRISAAALIVALFQPAPCRRGLKIRFRGDAPHFSCRRSTAGWPGRTRPGR